MKCLRYVVVGNGWVDLGAKVMGDFEGRGIQYWA